MLREIETDYGTISFDKNLITEMIYDAVEMFDGKVWLGNPGNRFQLRNNDDRSYMDIRFEEEKLLVDIEVIVSFGTSINAVTHDILSYIRLRIVEAFGEIDTRLKITVTGVQTNQQIARRNIEVEL